MFGLQVLPFPLSRLSSYSVLRHADSVRSGSFSGPRGELRELALTDDSSHDLVRLTRRRRDLAVDRDVDLVPQSLVVASDLESHGRDTDLLDLAGHDGRQAGCVLVHAGDVGRLEVLQGGPCYAIAVALVAEALALRERDVADGRERLEEAVERLLGRYSFEVADCLDDILDAVCSGLDEILSCGDELDALKVRVYVCDDFVDRGNRGIEEIDVGECLELVPERVEAEARGGDAASVGLRSATALCDNRIDALPQSVDVGTIVQGVHVIRGENDLHRGGQAALNLLELLVDGVRNRLVLLRDGFLVLFFGRVRSQARLAARPTRSFSAVFHVDMRDEQRTIDAGS